MTINQIWEKDDEYYKKLKVYEKIITENKNNYKLLLKTMDEIYKFLKEIAPVFYYTSDFIDVTELYHDLVNDVKFIESYIPNTYFIIPCEPTFIFQKEKPSVPNLNNPENLLDWLVYMAREQYAYTSFWTMKTSIEGLSFENECTNMSKKIANLCSKIGVDCKVKRINPGFEETARLYYGSNYHDICIVNINGESFLVDCTYRQFFMLKGNSLERIGIPYLSNTKPGIFMTLNNSRLKLSNTILSRGWINLTDENIKNYFDGFALSFRNGLYYDKTGDYSYTTNYSASDYIKFLEGLDSQVKHEGEEVLKKQLTISQYKNIAVK